MCIIALAWRADAVWPLLLAANRDEFHARPSEPLMPRATLPGLLAGRDLAAGGHWLGVVNDGRVAAVTNVRLGPAGARAPAPRSRGELVLAALRTARPDAPPELGDVDACGPFGLLLMGRELHYRSNVHEPGAPPAAGLHVLSNGPLNADWPKARRARALLDDWLQHDRRQPRRLLDAMQDGSEAADAELPDTGVGLALERRLSPLFLRDPVYGTRCTTVVAADADGNMQVWERSYAADGQISGERGYRCRPGMAWQPIAAS